MVEVLYTGDFEHWWDGLTFEQQRAVAHVVEMLADRGVALGHPYSSAICRSGIALRELRAQAGGRPLRVFYVFDPARQAVLLVGGDKTSRDRFYREMIRAAERIYAEYLRESGQG